MVNFKKEIDTKDTQYGVSDSAMGLLYNGSYLRDFTLIQGITATLANMVNTHCDGLIKNPDVLKYDLKPL